MKREMEIALNNGTLKKFIDRSYYINFNPNGGGYNTFCTGVFYDGKIIGFIPNVNMVKAPKVIFEDKLTYFAISRGVGNVVDVPKNIIVSADGIVFITPSISTGMMNGDTCLVQTNVPTVFILDAR